MIFVVFMSIAVYIIFLLVAFYSALIWLPREDVVSVCYCVPGKSPAVGVPLAVVMFVGLSPMLEAKLQIPMVIYQGLQIVGGSICITPFRNWIEKHKKVEQSNV
jgi:sodium/bile acid cotransporter 7